MREEEGLKSPSFEGRGGVKVSPFEGRGGVKVSLVSDIAAEKTSHAARNQVHVGKKINIYSPSLWYYTLVEIF